MSNLDRDFKLWLESFKESISTYDYYVDFNNVYSNTDEFKIELNILNSLIGSKNIKNDFLNLVTKYPETLKTIPILIAKREYEIFCTDEKYGDRKYNFSNANYTIEDYAYFMEKTGLFDLISNHTVASLYDYVLGVNTGLDSNGRKNRGGHLMEDLCESYIKALGKTYHKEMYIEDVEKKYGIDLSSISNNGDATKRFDYVIKGVDKVYGIECNFYSSGGSKLNETARSYKMIYEESKNINGFEFIWLTDGKGWTSARKNLKETFDVMENIYNIQDLKNDALKKKIK